MSNYILDWQVTAAIFIVVMVVMWALSSAIKLAKPIALGIAVGLALLIRNYWWWIEAQVTAWMRFMGLNV